MFESCKMAFPPLCFQILPILLHKIFCIQIELTRSESFTILREINFKESRSRIKSSKSIQVQQQLMRWNHEISRKKIVNLIISDLSAWSVVLHNRRPNDRLNFQNFVLLKKKLREMTSKALCLVEIFRQFTSHNLSYFFFSCFNKIVL